MSKLQPERIGSYELVIYFVSIFREIFLSPAGLACNSFNMGFSKNMDACFLVGDLIYVVSMRITVQHRLPPGFWINP